MVYPHKWSPISYRSSAGQRKHAGQRLTFCRWTTYEMMFLEDENIWCCTGLQASEMQLP